MYKYDTWPPILENTTEIRYSFAFLSCSVCFLSLNLVYSALRLSTRAFLRSPISCMWMANLRKTKKASLIARSGNPSPFSVNQSTTPFET